MSTTFGSDDLEQAALEAQIEPPRLPAPKTGRFDLSQTEIEAIRGISLQQADLKRRQDAVFHEIMDEEAPAGAVITAVDLDAGTATWSAP